MCAFEHCWWHTHVHGCVHTHVHSWCDGCNWGKVCSGKEATRHLTWGESLASCAAAAQLLLRLLERPTVVAADGIRLIRYYQPASDWGCNEAAGSWCTQVHLGGELPHVCPAQAGLVVQASGLKLDLLFLHISLHRWREMSASRDGCQGWRWYCPELALFRIPNSALKLTTSPGALRL